MYGWIVYAGEELSAVETAEESDVGVRVVCIVWIEVVWEECTCKQVGELNGVRSVSVDDGLWVR